MTTEQILKIADYPTDFVVIDFETYFDKEYSLSKMNIWAYITNERYQTIGCGFKFSTHGLGQFVWADELEKYFSTFQKLYGQHFENITIVMQNAPFDALILQEKYNISPKYIIDLKHLDAHFDSRRSHRLKDMAKRHKLQDKGNTMNFLGLHLEDMIEEQRLAMESYCKHDCKLEYELFEIFIQHLSNQEQELIIARHTIDLYLKPRLKFDFKLADSIAADMQVYIDEACEKVGLTKDEISGNLSFVKALQSVLPIGENVPVKAAKRPGKKMTALLGTPEVGPALAKTDEGCLMLLAHSKDEVRKLMEARKAVKSWPLHLKRIASMKVLATACGGRMPVPLNYYGAHTGRWSGGGGINLLNLGGAGRAGLGTNPLITKMRQMLRVNDSKLLIADAAQIEARILAWLAGQQDMLEAFAEGRDIYSEFGSKLFAARLRKARKTDPPPLAKLFTIRRGFAKDTVLGAGYGLGVNRFYNNCLQNPELRPMFDNGQYDRKFVEKLIYGYRNTYPMIPKFWKMCEKCFRLVVKYPHEIMRYAPEGSTVGPGDLLTFWNNRGTVNVQLPSGRVLYYPHASIKKKMNQYDYDNQLKYQHGPLWGGSLTENIVQAVARDLLVHWILKAEEFGLSVVLHIYDEILAVSSNIYAEDNLKSLMDIMSNGPEWANGLPLAAEGEISETYKK